MENNLAGIIELFLLGMVIGGMLTGIPWIIAGGFDTVANKVIRRG